MTDVTIDTAAQKWRTASVSPDRNAVFVLLLTLVVVPKAVGRFVSYTRAP